MGGVEKIHGVVQPVSGLCTGGVVTERGGGASWPPHESRQEQVGPAGDRTGHLQLPPIQVSARVRSDQGSRGATVRDRNAGSLPGSESAGYRGSRVTP
eukprot:7977-Hanusia_phi.AAC.1